jgi:hypothetical protein
LQFIFQPAYSDGDVYNAEASTVACVYLGFFLMPAFLDYLVRTTPVQPRPEYYGLAKDAYYKEDLPTIWLGMAPQKDCNNCTTKGMSSSKEECLETERTTSTRPFNNNFQMSNPVHEIE